ncbi:hypothetical protein T484DRAFT_1898247, partial [Baffinella frigidus]
GGGGGRVQVATVTAFSKSESSWGGNLGGWYTLVWDHNGEEERRDLGSDSIEWRLAEDEAGIDIPAPEFQCSAGWDKVQGFDALWAIALSAEDDLVAHKAQSVLTRVLLCYSPPGALLLHATGQS